MRTRGYTGRYIAVSAFMVVLAIAMVAVAAAQVVDPVIAGLIATSALARAGVHALAARAVDPVIQQWVRTPMAALKQFSNLGGAAVLVVIGVWQIRSATATEPADGSVVMIGVVTLAVGAGGAALLLWAEYRTRQVREIAYAGRKLFLQLGLWDTRHDWICVEAEEFVYALQDAQDSDFSRWSVTRQGMFVSDGARALGDWLSTLDGELSRAIVAFSQQFVAWAGRRKPFMI